MSNSNNNPINPVKMASQQAQSKQSKVKGQEIPGNKFGKMQVNMHGGDYLIGD